MKNKASLPLALGLLGTAFFLVVKKPNDEHQSHEGNPEKSGQKLASHFQDLDATRSNRASRQRPDKTPEEVKADLTSRISIVLDLYGGETVEDLADGQKEAIELIKPLILDIQNEINHPNQESFLLGMTLEATINFIQNSPRTSVQTGNFARDMFLKSSPSLISANMIKDEAERQKQLGHALLQFQNAITIANPPLIVQPFTPQIDNE